MMRILKHYWLISSISVAAWVAVWWFLGFEAFVITVILSVLEITLSADNAVVNSRVLTKLSVFWQNMFLTVGIFLAVFVVRFILPIVMVAFATSLGLMDVFNLALNNPDEYGRKLHDVAPLIDGFGGMFLFMVAVFFFFDQSRRDRWLRWPENFFAKLSKIPLVKLLVAALLLGAVVLILPVDSRLHVGVAMALGAATYALLFGVTLLMERVSDEKSTVQQVGWAAFSLFMYLQVLDASFSLDGVVGAFALTNNILIIMTGLGVGALWVRTFTIYMVRHDTLTKYKYLESGAHWAIVCLAFIMILKLIGVELPEIVIGTVGLVFIVAAIYSSTHEAKSNSSVSKT